MTEEQNKLAEEIERQLRNDGLRIPVEELSDASPHAMVYRRVQMPAPSWKLVIAALRADEIRALKGKGASQGETIAASQELRAGEGSSGTRSAGMSDQSPAVAAPEPSGEFVRVPREPTDAMLKAAWHQQNPNMPEAALGYSTGASADYNRATYRAMLAASLDEQKG